MQGAHYFKSLATRTSFAAAISGLVISLWPSLCCEEEEWFEEEDTTVKGFLSASLSFSVVVLWDVVSEYSGSSVAESFDGEGVIVGSVGREQDV